MNYRTISLIVPVWNEAATLGAILKKLAQLELPKGFIKEIIIIDDGSQDKSARIIKNFINWNKNSGSPGKQTKYKYFTNKRNLGKTQTVKKGILKSTGDYVIIQDADLEYEPKEIPMLLNLLLKHNLDVVYGNRFGRKNEVIHWHYYFGNRFLSLFSNLFTYPRIRKFIPDIEVCYKMIAGDTARKIAARISTRSRFGLEPEITARLARYLKKDRSHLRFGVFPVTYRPRTQAQGKKIRISDGLKALKEILKYNLF
ncbi:MAG TPA: glycosyltransferase family 2 protein [Candidatus Dojkabacteria bacterium]|nr:glycosyltransferase family 2 protein [Candidatus Dojkabacteria bacterium]